MHCAHLLVSTAPGCGTDTTTATPLLHPTNSLLLSPLQQQQAALLSPNWQATKGSNCSRCAVGSSCRMNTPPSAATAAQRQPSLLTATHTTATCRQHAYMHTRQARTPQALKTVCNIHVIQAVDSTVHSRCLSSCARSCSSLTHNLITYNKQGFLSLMLEDCSVNFCQLRSMPSNPKCCQTASCLSCPLVNAELG